MTVLRGRRLAAVGTKESYTITRPAPTENSGLTTVLPTSEPGTSQIIVTVASGDFYLPAGLAAPYIGVILAQVLNNDGPSRTLSWRMIKNGSSVVTSTLSVFTTQRGRVQAFFSPTAVSGDNQGVAVVAGDVIELRLWSASSTNVQLVYWTYYLLDTRTRPTEAQAVMEASIVVTAGGTTGGYPTLSSWPGGGTQTTPTLPALTVGDDPNTVVAGIVSGQTWAPKRLGMGGYGLVRQGSGDLVTANNSSTQAAASPTYLRHSVISSATLRRVPIV